MSGGEGLVMTGVEGLVMTKMWIKSKSKQFQTYFYKQGEQ